MSVAQLQENTQNAIKFIVTSENAVLSHNSVLGGKNAAKIESLSVIFENFQNFTTQFLCCWFRQTLSHFLTQFS